MMITEDLIIVVQIVAACIQGFATIGILLTFIVYFLQLSTMQRQLEVSKSAATSQNLIALVNFLQDEKTQDARRVVIRILSSKAIANWTKEEERAAAKVCSTYDIAGISIREGLIPSAPIVNNWGASIKKCYKILQPYIWEMKKRNGPSYWDDFGWLEGKAKDINSYDAD